MTSAPSHRLGLLTVVRLLLDVLGTKGRRECIVLVMVMLVNAVAEVMGVASLLPLLTVATEPSLIVQNPWLHAAYQGLGFTQPRSFLVFLGLLFLVLFVLANAWSAFTFWLCFGFSMRMSHQISVTLLGGYLYRPYAWHLKHNSADLVRTVTEEADHLVEQVILTATVIVNRALGALCISTGVLLLDPRVAIATTVALSVLYILVYRFFEPRIDALGKARLERNGERFRRVLEALGAVKEARCSSARADFLERFRIPDLEHSRVVASARTIHKMPGYFTECLALIAIVVMFLWLVLTASNPARVFPLLGIYIMATWRLVPMLQNLYGDLVDIQFYLPLLQRIHGELSDPSCSEARAPLPPPLDLRESICLRDVTFTYPEAPGPAVRGVTLEIERNTSVALVGVTGKHDTP